MLTQPKDQQVLDKLDKLEMLDKLHEKAGWEVYQGNFSGEPVAVKRVGVEGMLSKNFLNLHRELMTFKSTSHPKILKLVEVIFDTQAVLIITELCTGGSISRYIGSGKPCRFSWVQKHAISLQLAEGMAYLHGLVPSIIHRGLSTGSTLLKVPLQNEEDVPDLRITEFSYARTLDAVASTQLDGSCWVAPEILLGLEYGQLADVYSYGMILFHLLYETQPFADLHSESQLVLRIADGQRPPHEVPPGCPDPLHETMLACWAQSPEERPSFQEVRSKF